MKPRDAALLSKRFLDGNGPFSGTRYDVAAAIGIPTWEFDAGLKYCRDNATVLGWVIPRQQHGTNPALWRVIDNLSNLTPDEETAIVQSTTKGKSTLQGILLRLVEQERLAASATAGTVRTQHLKAAKILDGAAAML